MKHDPRFETLVNEVRPRIRECDCEAVKQRLDAGEAFHLIDVRDRDEWENGHLPSAVHVSKGVIERDIGKVAPDENAEIVLYCGGGYRSALAADNLQKMGYKHVTSMDGGFKSWKDAGHPVIKPTE